VDFQRRVGRSPESKEEIAFISIVNDIRISMSEKDGMKIFEESYKADMEKTRRPPKFISYKYSYLFIAIMAQFVLAPLLETRIPLTTSFLYLILMLAVLGTLGLRKIFLRVLLGLGLLAFLFIFLAKTFRFPLQESFNFYLVGLSINALFLAIAIAVLIMKIFAAPRITAETIKGGISVYFLIGFLWAYLYSLLMLLDQQALSFTSGSFEYTSLTYFSFTTLTTLGYGDITPVSWLARNLTILESTFGQIYLTVLIARLVGLHIAGKRQAVFTPDEEK
jgi:hypothetical protein